MFYAHIILAKKGPLARVWLAAHWDKKITKAHVFETNIEKSVEGIMQPKVKLALRTSGHLLLGVVRIYSRKAKYLLADCNEAFVKIKMAFRPGMVDLPEGHREANVNAITLPEVFHDFDTALPELNDIDIEAQFSVNQSRADEITMREDYGSLSISLQDDGFGDIGFDGDTPDLIRGALGSSINDQLFEDQIIAKGDEQSHTKLSVENVASSHAHNIGLNVEFDQPELFADDLFGEPALDSNNDLLKPNQNILQETEDDLDRYNTLIPSPPSCDNSESNDFHDGDDIGETDAYKKQEDKESSTIILNDESFALAPVDASAYKGFTKSKRKRKLIVDEIKNISGEEMKAQLANTSDIVTTLDLAPPTKRLMYWKETGGVEKLFSLPSRPISARVLVLNYSRHLISHFTQLDDFSCLGSNDLLALDQINAEIEFPLTQNKRGRKRKVEPVTVSQVQGSDKATDSSLQNLTIPELVRCHGDTQVTAVSVNIENSSQDSHKMCNDATIFEDKNSQVEDILCRTDDGLSLHDLPIIPGITNSDLDINDDFHQGDSTPAELHHGHFTPVHSSGEHFDADNIASLSTDKELRSIPNECFDHSNDCNDYHLSPSIGIQNIGDEQMENETMEQFEERVLNKRAAQLFFAVKKRLLKHDFLLTSEVTSKSTRKQAAQIFYSLLVLKKFRALDISQAMPYADIEVTRGPLFENPKL